MNVYKTEGFYNSKDIEQLMECKKTKAYRIIQELNKERKKQGLITISGKISADYFNKRFFEEESKRG